MEASGIFCASVEPVVGDGAATMEEKRSPMATDETRATTREAEGDEVEVERRARGTSEWTKGRGKKRKSDLDGDSDEDYDAVDMDEDSQEEDWDDEDFEARARGRSAKVGAGAKIVDGKVVATVGDGSVEGDASKLVKVTAGGAVRADRKGSDPTIALLAALREYVAKCGGYLSDDWTCTATMRTNGASAGTYDALYWSPGKQERYRSRLEVIRALGLAPQKELKSAKTKKTVEHIEPISREEAVKKAQESETPTTPMDLGENTIVVDFGRILSEDDFHDDVHIWPVGYTTTWQNDSGVIFTSKVTSASDGAPEFIVTTEIDGNVVSACSASPLGAWVEMCEAVGPTVSVGIVDHFAFEDVRVVRAIESLHGSDKCEKYQYVEERSGWDDERVRRAKARVYESRELLAKIRLVAKKAKTEKRAMSKVERTVESMIERLISRVDAAVTRERQRDERILAKKALAADAKKHRDSLKEAAKAEREAAKEAAKMKKEAQRETEKIAKEAAKAKAAIEREAKKELNKAKRAKEAEEKKIRDAERAALREKVDKKQKEWLTGMQEREPDSTDTSFAPPVMTPNLKIEPDFTETTELGDILEIWMFLDRFKRELFGPEADAKSPPSVQSLARVLSKPQECEELLACLHLSLIAPCVADVAASTDKSSAQALQLVPDGKAHLSETKGVWKEVLRRFLHASSVIYDMPSYEPFLKDAPPILPEAADVFTRYMCAGNSGVDPLSYEEGPTWTGHPVEKYNVRISPALCAIAEAEVLAAAEAEMFTYGSGGVADDASRVVDSRRQKATNAIREARHSQKVHAVRCALRNISYQHAFSQVCRRGDAAAVKGQHPRGLDLRLFDARLEAGVYCAAAHSTETETEELIRTDALETAKNIANLTNGNGAKAQKDLMAAIEGAIKQTKAPEEQLPAAPWQEGCIVCGLDVMAGVVLLCDSCDAEYHTKCLDPPLSAEPEGEWFCPTCVRNKENVNPTPSVYELKAFKGTKLEKAATGETIAVRDAAMENEDDEENSMYTGGSRGAMGRRLRSLARALDSVGFEGLSVQSRVTLMRTLVALALDSVALRTSIDNGVNMANEVKKDIRQHVKAWSEYRLDREDGKGDARDAEEAKAAEEATKEVAEPMDVDGEAEPGEEKKSEQEKKEKKKRVPKAEEKIPTDQEIAVARVRWQKKWHEVEVPALNTAPRRDVLGSDRHRQKYWALGNWGEVIVQAAKDSEHYEVEPEYGILTLEDTKALIGKINPKGRREGDLWRSLQRRYGADPDALKEISPVPERPDDSAWGMSESAGDAEDALSRVRAAFLNLDSEIPDVAFNEVLGSPERRTMWRNLAASARSLSSLAAAIVVFERAIEGDWLQSGWMSWSWVSPLMRSATRSNEKSDGLGLRLHLIALRRAFKWNKATRVSDRIAHIPASTEPLAPRAARAKRIAVVESDSDDDDYEEIFSDSEEVVAKTTSESRRFRL